ncbi:DUF3566 domain-containing protein [Nocardioides terrisoli]|uniref:DUF3566 domain-containing protein n=1 Tax=Nocardioides terrisoli TaxID=3388267 RepID=UPI00287BC04E|nr:DUF3566 domain-containing protein [Nocardioides marmorisolisilvae]
MAKGRQKRNQKYRMNPRTTPAVTAERDAGDGSQAAPTIAGSTGPVSGPSTGAEAERSDRRTSWRPGVTSSERESGSAVAADGSAAPQQPSSPVRAAGPSPSPAGSTAGAERRTRKARLRLVHIDPWSVMKTAFLLSIAIGITCVVAVAIIWGVLGAAGVWDSINSMVDQTVGSGSGTPFDITHYIGTSRAVGFTMIAAVIDVILITALSTLGAFIYNLAATLIGGVEMTLAEDR